MRSAELKPDLPAFMFPAQSKATQQPTSSRPRSRAEREDFEEHEGSAAHTSPLTLEGDEFGDNDLDDQDMMNVGKFTYRLLIPGSSDRHCSRRDGLQ